MADRVGQQLGNYRLIRLLGRGGFAEVYLGEHQRLQTKTAIKVLRTQLADDDVESFLNEARTIAHLEHPHIVRVLDFDVQEGTPFLVMSYAPNGNLRQRHSKGTILPLNIVLSYIKQISDALQYAHDEKLIHRDIKPENMLIGRRGDILLSDFGIALVAQSSRLQSTQEIIGTAAYMAPEQFQGKPRQASDQYALGIVVYEWLCGNRPFSGNFTELFSQHMFVPPPSLRAKIVTIPLAVEQVMKTALAKAPKERFGSVQAFATAFEQACQSSRLTRSHTVIQPSQTPTLLPNQPLSSTKNVGVPSYVPLSEAINVVTPPNQVSQSIRSSTNRASMSAVTPPVRRRLSPSSPQLPKQSISRRTVVVGLAGLALAGSGIAWFLQTQAQSASSSNYAAKHLPIFHPPTLFIFPGHIKSVTGVAWSPDSKRIASASVDKTVQVWDATTGNHVYVYHGHSQTVNAVAWSPDGKYIASGSDDKTVQVWEAITGKRILIYSGHSSRVQTVKWSPDGSRIVSGDSNDSVSVDITGTVQVWDASTGSNIYSYQQGYGFSVDAVAWSPDGKLIASGDYGYFDGYNLLVLEAPSGKVLTKVDVSEKIYAVAWASDNRHIAYGLDDGNVSVVDATSGSTSFTYHGHSGTVYAVAWSPDGNYISSASFDKTVQIWNAISGSTSFTYHGHSDAVDAVAWSPDGKQIASGSWDNTVQVWQAP